MKSITLGLVVAAMVLYGAAASIQTVQAEEKELVSFDTTEEEMMASLDLGEVSVIVITKIISDLTGVNFAVSDEIANTIITAKMSTRVPCRTLLRAFESILESNGLSMVRNGEIALIVPAQQKDAITRKLKAGEGEEIESEELVSIDFNKVDITIAAQFVSDMTGTNYVVSDGAKSTEITIMAPTKIPMSRLRRAFESSLAANGLATVSEDEMVEIVPAH